MIDDDCGKRLEVTIAWHYFTLYNMPRTENKKLIHYK